MRVIIAGGRDFNDFELLCNEVLQILYCSQHKDIEIISGTARGADILGEKFAKKYNHRLKRMPANWEQYGKSAGHRRNADMAKYASGDEGVLIAFWDGKSRGTKGMIDVARRYGLEVNVIKY